MELVRDDSGKFTLPGHERVFAFRTDEGAKALYVSQGLGSEGFFVFGAFGFFLVSVVVSAALWELAVATGSVVVQWSFHSRMACWLAVAVVSAFATNIAASALLSGPALIVVSDSRLGEQPSVDGPNSRLELYRPHRVIGWMMGLPSGRLRSKLLRSLDPQYRVDAFVLSGWMSVKASSGNVDFCRLANKGTGAPDSKRGRACLSVEVTMYDKPHVTKRMPIFVSVLGVQHSLRVYTVVAEFVNSCGFAIDQRADEVVVSGHAYKSRPPQKGKWREQDQGIRRHMEWLETGH